MSCKMSCSQLEAEPKPEPKDGTSTHSKQARSLAPPSLTVVGSEERPPLRGRGIWAGTGLEQGWQFLLVVVVKVGIGGHQVEQVLIAGCSQLLGVLG